MGVSQHHWDAEHVRIQYGGMSPSVSPSVEIRHPNRKYDADRVLGASWRVKTRDELRLGDGPLNRAVACACFSAAPEGHLDSLRCFNDASRLD